METFRLITIFKISIAHNVLGWRRFDSPNKQMRSICRAGKLWAEQGVGASVATDLALRNPSRLLVAYANRLLYEVGAFHILLI